MAINHNDDVQIAVYLSSSSQYMQRPADLATLHPALSHQGKVGELSDVQLVSVKKNDWERDNGEVLSRLKSGEGVTRVEVQQNRQRVKRGGDEF